MVRREEIRVMQDAWRAYLDLALGATETSRKKATKVAKKLVGRGNATAEQLQSMAEELVSTSKANREALSRLVRFELERALSRVGLATADEVNALSARVKELEQELDEAKNGRAAVPASAASASAKPPPAAKKAVARKTVAKKAVVPVRAVEPTPEAPVVAAPATPAPRKAAAAKKAPAKAAPAGPAPVKKTVAKKAVAKKAPAVVAETPR
jgi:polyhydroxyalkanoate synthesis regulator phasin